MTIVDASVGYKWIAENEPYRGKAKALYIKHQRSGEKILVPTLFFLEIANALTTKSKSTKEDIATGLKFLDKRSYR